MIGRKRRMVILSLVMVSHDCSRPVVTVLALRRETVHDVILACEVNEWSWLLSFLLRDQGGLVEVNGIRDPSNILIRSTDPVDISFQYTSIVVGRCAVFSRREPCRPRGSHARELNAPRMTC